jgi:hypothetical protein
MLSVVGSGRGEVVMEERTLFDILKRRDRPERISDQKPPHSPKGKPMADDTPVPEATKTADPTPRLTQPGVPKAKAEAKTASKTRPAVKVSPGSASVKKAATTSRPKVRRPFPQNALEEALVVPQAVKEKNNGKPLEPE